MLNVSMKYQKNLKNGDSAVECGQKELAMDRKRKHYQIAKRLFDVIGAGIGLAVMLVPMILVAIIIKLESPGPVIYVHNRIGKNGRPLPLLKFRTMYMDADKRFEQFTPEQKAEWEKNFKLENDPRVTPIGNFLRRSSLDELPQLINILKGELSIVGPRPVLPKELERYGENKEKFLSAMPGLTGYWQAYARSTCTYEERIKMELHYVDNANFWWDIKIVFATVIAVLRGHGAR